MFYANYVQLVLPHARPSTEVSLAEVHRMTSPPIMDLLQSADSMAERPNPPLAMQTAILTALHLPYFLKNASPSFSAEHRTPFSHTVGDETTRT